MKKNRQRTTALARTLNHLRTARRRRLLRTMRANAVWAEQARSTPHIQSWLDDHNIRGLRQETPREPEDSTKPGVAHRRRRRGT